MSMQEIINQGALAMLPRVNAAIQAADSFDSNQMDFYAIHYVCNLNAPLIDLNDQQIKNVDDELISIFTHKGWIA